MKTRTLEELERIVKERSKRRRAQVLERLEKNYRLARTLGFSSYEAVVLQNWSEDTIRQLAVEKQERHA